MKHPVVPFAMPRTIAPDLVRVRAYWESLKRGGNNMPFWDDVKTSSLPDLSDRLMLVDVFEKPQRFRLNFVGQQLIDRYGESITGNFVDEMELRHPLQYLASQCCATVESRTPTYYSRSAAAAEKSPGLVAYSRILLPMWGNGHIGMLLGVVKWQ